jgi:heme exporter protein C
MNTINQLANPTVFMRISGAILPFLAAAVAIAFIIGLYMVTQAPQDYQQGETVRIMFVHVPASWLAMFGYIAIVISSIGSLVWRHPLADVSAKSAVPIGAAFAFISLVTGSLWGKPMWGTYWVWDARLTSMLVLFFLYLGLMAIWQAIEDHTRAAHAAAILACVGVINIPIIKFSVNWWNTLHQRASITPMGGSAIDPSLLWPLLAMAIAFTLLFLWIHLKAMRAEVLRRRVTRIMLTQAQPGAQWQPAE